jgi:hypothetical protein
VTSGSINVDAPILSAVQAESSISVTQGKNFSVSFYLIDEVSKMKIPNPAWKVSLQKKT